MLEQLFGSKTRVNLLKLFLNNPDKPYYLREITRKLKTQLNSVRREVSNLEKLGIIRAVDMDELESQKEGKKKKAKSKTKKYYLIDDSFLLFSELKALFLKSQLVLESNFINQIKKIPKLQLLILTGIFVNKENTGIDVLVVGDVNKRKISLLIKKFEKDLNHEVRYAVLTRNDYKYRKDITDKFLYSVLEESKIIVHGQV